MTGPTAVGAQVGSLLRRGWAGPWLMAVAALHTAFAAVVFAKPLGQIAAHGVWNGIDQDPVRRAAVWFVLFGAVLALLGGAVAGLERAGTPGQPALRPLGWGLLALALLGIVLMPASGFWLALPPALALCSRRAAPPPGLPHPSPPHSP